MTIIKKIDRNQNDGNYNYIINRGAEIIKNGGIVAFPTETVYGLGADALNPSAVEKIYKAKGRPSDNPLIVHIGSFEELYPLVSEVTKKAEKLIREFWPGPLTLVFKKSDVIPLETSGGLDTVAIRFPEDKVAQDLIKRSNVPIAAPSANSSGKPSPTRASHVEFDLYGKIDMIIDGGSCAYGLESTIVDVSLENPSLLRPGSITKEMLENILGQIEVDKSIVIENSEINSPKAPGMKYTHYSPVAKVTIVKGELDKMIEKINLLADEYMFIDKQPKKIGILATKQTKHNYDSSKFLVLEVGDRENEDTIAANLFKMLRKFDYYNVDYVFAEGFLESEIGLAIMNRLKKASGYNIITV